MINNPINFLAGINAAANSNSSTNTSLSDAAVDKYMKKYSNRSDNWLRKRLKGYEDKLANIQSNPMFKNNTDPLIKNTLGTFNTQLSNKVARYKAVLEKRGQAAGQSRSGSGPHEQDFNNEWGDQGVGGLATEGGDDFGYLSAVQPDQVSTGNIASQVQTFSPQTTGAANEMFGSEDEEESFDRILPPTPGMINPDDTGINSLYNTN